MPEVALRLHTREQITLKVQLREERGKGPVGQLRRLQAQLPGVLYGHKQEPYPFKTEARELERIFKRAGRSILLNIEFEEEDRAPEQAIVREVQYHKVEGNVMHLDLLRIDPTETRTVSVPLQTKGVPEGVSTGGGALQQTLTHLDMDCVISDMPSSVEIDITELVIGDSIHVSDLLEQESRIVTDPEISIINVLAPRLTIDDELELEAAAAAEAAEGEEGEEGEEIEGEEGEGAEGEEGEGAEGEEGGETKE